MTIRIESEITEAPVFIDRMHDFDMHTLDEVSRLVEMLPGSRLVVTGSYAVEALTGVSLPHDDIDANVFTDNLISSLPQVATKLERLGNFNSHIRTDSRLEYHVNSEDGSFSPRRLEIQFLETDEVNEDDSLVFTLKDTNFAVPIVKLPIIDSAGNKSVHRVKSLPYLIATWAIRISGAAEKQKREVRDSDLDHLRLLLAGVYTQEDVILAMSKHPQMPNEMSETNVLSDTLNKL